MDGPFGSGRRPTRVINFLLNKNIEDTSISHEGVSDTGFLSLPGKKEIFEKLLLDS